MIFINECPINLVELTKDNACLVKVPPGWMKQGEQNICYFISKESLLSTAACPMTRRNTYYFSINLSDLPEDLLRNLLLTDSEPYALISDNQTLIQRTENFPWVLHMFPKHERVARSSASPVMHAFSSSLIFGAVSMLAVYMLKTTVDEDVVERNRLGLFVFVLLMSVTGGAAEYCLRNTNYNSSGLFSEGLRLLRAIPSSAEPHRHALTQQF